MEVEYEKTGPCEAKLSITIPAVRVDTAFEDAYRQVGKSARIPGFRQGKAPKRVLEAHYKDQVRHDVENQLIQDTLHVAIVGKKVAAVATPQVESGDLDPGEAFSYTAQVETHPDVVLKNYVGLKAPDVDAVVSDNEVAEELTALQKQGIQLVPVQGRDIVEDEDLVLADFQGFHDGKPLEGADGEGALFEMGGEEHLPGVNEALMGAKVPSSLEIPVVFPDDFSVESWRGLETRFELQLKEIKHRDLPIIDDEFAKDLGDESLEDLKANIRSRLEEQKETELKGEQRQALLQSLVDENPVAIPPSMVDAQAEHMIMDAANRMRQMMGPQFSLDDLDLDTLRESSRDRAAFQVRCGLLLFEVGKQEKLQISDEQLNAEIVDLVTKAGESKKQVAAHYADPKHRKDLSYKLLENKTVAFLLEKATIVATDESASDENA